MNRVYPILKICNTFIFMLDSKHRSRYSPCQFILVLLFKLKEVNEHLLLQ